MDFDLEIISDEGDHPDPDSIFGSIMSAMNSMKEATADKIYQKIQKEGATNYSKPQVDRALESALKYGIFEVRNNRYRVKDDILDDEDTVYWKSQKKKANTPFRISETGRQTGLRLDPENDKQRYKKPKNSGYQECPHCGRIKKPTIEENNKDGRKVRKTSTKKRKPYKKEKRRKSDNTPEPFITRRSEKKRKVQLDLSKVGRSSKRRKLNGPKDNELQLATNADTNGCYSEEKLLKDLRKEGNLLQGACNDSDLDLLLSSDRSVKSNSGGKTDFSKTKRNTSSQYAPEGINEDIKVVKAKRSSISLKSESDSEKTVASSASDDLSNSRTADGFFDSQIPNSQSTSDKTRNKYLSSAEVYDSQYERHQTHQSKEDSVWLECSDEPQVAIFYKTKEKFRSELTFTEKEKYSKMTQLAKKSKSLFPSRRSLLFGGSTHRRRRGMVN